MICFSVSVYTVRRVDHGDETAVLCKVRLAIIWRLPVSVSPLLMFSRIPPKDVVEFTITHLRILNFG